MSKRLRILIVDDEAIVHQTVGNYLKDSGHDVEHASNGKSGLDKTRENVYDIVLVDIRMPELDGLTLIERAQEYCPETAFVVITGHADMETAIAALRRDAADFLPKPIKLEELDAVLSKALHLQGLRNERRKLHGVIANLQGKPYPQEDAWEFIGVSTDAQAVRDQIAQVATAECETVLITGETGTGKEVVARAIHRTISGETAPFIAIACPAIPKELVESELFGHVKGAFTGAMEQRLGAFELADGGGTLFLDEVGDLAANIQSALLRVLESRSFRRLGGMQEITVTLRVIAATNVSLEEAVKNGRFRHDLYYRLNMFRIHISPLRERKQDIVPLAEYFLQVLTRKGRCGCTGITKEAGTLLTQYDYPGNGRELRNIIERACIAYRVNGSRGPLGTQHLEHLPRQQSLSEPHRHSADSPPDERTHLLNILTSCRWNRREAARELGMAYSTLRYKIDKYGLER